MSRFTKIGILLVLLAIPIFLLIIFEFFSTSHYDVPVYYKHGIDTLAQCESSSEVHRLTALQASDALTREMQFVDFRNRLRVVYWVPDACEDTCRLVLEELARLQGVFERQAALQVLFVSKPTLNDVPELMQTYRQESARWLFLQGTEAQNRSFLQCELLLPQPEMPLSETVILIDEEGRIRGYYQATLPEEVDRLIGEIRILLYNLERK